MNEPSVYIFTGLAIFVSATLFFAIVPKEWMFMAIEKLIEWKIDFQRKWFPQPIFGEMKIEKIELYNGKEKELKKDLTKICKNITYYDQKVIQFYYETFFEEKILNHPSPSDIRIRFEYSYHHKKYILYFPYIAGIQMEGIQNDHYLYLPWVSKDKMEKYREDLIEPFYKKTIGKYLFYSLFMMDSKNLGKVKVNGKLVNKEFMEYMEKIRSPYGDYGILWNIPVKIKWMLMENGYNWKEFENMEIEFLEMYFDEATMDLKEHKMKMDHVENYVVTDYMMKKIKEKNEYYQRKIEIYEKKNE